MQKPRRPGDQAPPPRPTHRNEHIHTASTHVKDASGMYFVHDGSPEKVVLSIDGRELAMLSYDEARRGKDLAVARLKARQAGIAPMPTDDTGSYTAPNKPSGEGGFVGATQALSDPHLEAQRQKAVAAARATALQAEARANAQRGQKAPGWEAPPQGVSGAGKPSASAPAQQRAPGWVDPSKGKSPPEKPPIVGIDPLPDLEANDEGAVTDPDVADLLINADLETDVKAETEKARSDAQKLWDSIDPARQGAITATLIQIADSEEARTLYYGSLEPQQVQEFEAIEIAYRLLFGAPAKAVAS